jgi:hypothetical protein
MRKFIAAVVSITAIAALAVPALASASVERYQTQTATFTVLQPRDSIGQYNSVWKHDYKVTINPCNNTFTGNGNVTDGVSNSTVWTENITGSFGDRTVSFDTVPNAGATFRVVNAPYNTSVLAESTWTQNIIEMKASAPQITSTSNYKNHGDYVSSQGGGDDAAHSCIGMPINSGK